MKKTWIKVYEVCPQCKGTCWMDEEKDSEFPEMISHYEGEPCLECEKGKISRLVKIDINRNSTQMSIFITN